jgi:hypothetical protein
MYFNLKINNKNLSTYLEVVILKQKRNESRYKETNQTLM